MTEKQARELAEALAEHGITTEATDVWEGEHLYTWYVIATIGTTGHGVEWIITQAEAT